MSHLAALSFPCLYMERTLRDSVISSVDKARWLADVARAETRDKERGDRWVVAGEERSCCAVEGGCPFGRGGVLGAGVPGTTRSICLLRLFAFLPPKSMLPLLEKEICESAVRSSKLPVGMTVSRHWKRMPFSC